MQTVARIASYLRSSEMQLEIAAQGVAFANPAENHMTGHESESHLTILLVVAPVCTTPSTHLRVYEPQSSTDPIGGVRLRPSIINHKPFRMKSSGMLGRKKW